MLTRILRYRALYSRMRKIIVDLSPKRSPRKSPRKVSEPSPPRKIRDRGRNSNDSHDSSPKKIRDRERDRERERERDRDRDSRTKKDRDYRLGHLLIIYQTTTLLLSF